MEKVKSGISDTIIAVRGGGDLATGVIQKLVHVGFKVVVLETAQPLAIRRTVALCNAVFQNKQQVEDLEAVLVTSVQECYESWRKNQVPVLIDPNANSLAMLNPLVLVDAILAKKNLGTKKSMAPITIALGPGFSAPTDVDVVIETMRGHYLGRLYFEGGAIPNTGIPGEIGGKSAERVIHSPASGNVKHAKKIGDVVKKGEVLCYVDQMAVHSPLDGVLRGLISDQVNCSEGLKCGDVDPRPAEQVDCFTISDKARALGGAVLEAVFMLGRQKKLF
ncbi:YqeB family selenium-dependent molybdenum hydroxylase system protein [Enterococcus sp. DIV0212c]|uniref:selenium-dependent molybdenum cofactor biosynthesis protein YqeB n=1 Tax=Enterococcus sp. DIV0212c TaxID=2230867 RepID=UPI001A9B3C5E|nr:selenium-dependent molybdenum cofactor biosynthesis protein YqeB [Enterococcus sp. DIV0212c]MBO1354056.1 EF2563 family selenium-dependent molybdenum hydroxylase system protein [Enterococcus sp. DIV0212c]